MTRPILHFVCCITILASCKCGDPKVSETTTATTMTSSTGEATNLRDMTTAVSNNSTNAAPNEPGEAAMNRMYGKNEAAQKAMAARSTMRKEGKLANGYYPEGSQRKLNNEDIKYLSKWGHTIMLNEIYARHGMTFTDDALITHFSKQPWYHPVSANIYQELNTVEKQNITFLINTMPGEDLAAN